MPASSSTKPLNQPINELSAADRQALLALVWQVIDKALTGAGLELPSPPKADALQRHAACFVTLYHRGQLRGCIGTLETNTPLWRCACTNVYASAFNDRRFAPLGANERAHLSLDISILSPLTPIPNRGETALLGDLSPGIDGLLMKEGDRHALFLPSVWRSLSTPEAFLCALKQKGGWPQDYWSDTISLHRFTTQVVSS